MFSQKKENRPVRVVNINENKVILKKGQTLETCETVVRIAKVERMYVAATNRQNRSALFPTDKTLNSRKYRLKCKIEQRIKITIQGTQL